MRDMELQGRLPKVSVRFTSHQHAKYIGESIRSVLAQDFQDFDIEITDDCSTDNSVEIIRGFKDPRIHLKVQDHNRGVASTATESLRRCRGEYTACMCSDDVWLPNKLSQQVSFLDNHPEIEAVFTLVDIINEESQITTDSIFSNIFATTNKSRAEWLRQFFFSGNSLCIPSVLIRTATYKSLNGQNPTLSGLSDFDLWVRFCIKHDFYILPEVLTQFRLRDDNGNESGYTIGNRLRCLLEMQHILGHFTKMEDLSLFVEAFPESKTYGIVTLELIPYFLSRIAMDTNIFYLQLFGYILLTEFMQIEENRILLENKFSFYTSDLHNYSKRIDPHNIQTINALQRQNEALENQLSEIQMEYSRSPIELAELRKLMESKDLELSANKILLEKYRQVGGDTTWEFTNPLRALRLRAKRFFRRRSGKSDN